MNKYHNGKIYKVVDVGYNKCYIGSTCESLSQRLARHRWKYTQYLKGTSECTRSFKLFDEYGLDNCKIELIEDFSCNSKDELLKQEGHHIKTNDCINKQIAGRSNKQWNIDNKEHLQQYKNDWYKEHMEETKERAKKHREDNKEHYVQKNKEYYDLHKEEMKQKKKIIMKIIRTRLMKGQKKKLIVFVVCLLENLI